MFDFIKNLSTTEWVIIAIVLFVFFGATKMKDLSRGLGESTKELKKVKKEIENINEPEK
jgi:TatA/E family protein of Tat protein translocase